MSKSWYKSTIEELCHIDYGTRVVRKRDGGSKYPVYGGGGETFRMDTFTRSNSLVVARFAMSKQCTRFVEGDFYLNDSGLTIRPKNENLWLRFLDYQLLSLNDDIYALGRGTAQKNLEIPALKKLLLVVPPLSEQKQIVAILDEASDGIAAAVTNAEKNLANAHELFESYLNAVFTKNGEGWVDTTVGKQITLQRGFDITKKQQNPGNIPVVSSGGIKSYHDMWKVKGPGVVIGRKGSLGTVFHITANFWPHDTTLWVKDFKGNDPKLVYYFLRALDVEHLDSGTANPALNRNIVHPIKVSWPVRERQTQIIETLDNLSIESHRLEAIYKQKLTALDELKQSILQKAFAGELISDVMTVSAKAEEVETTSPEFTAKILDFAYRRHALQQRDKTFGHVKAQKFLHLVESIGGIELGRKPIKAAAGPHDSKHMLKAEDWAEANNFFKFHERDGGYKFNKLNRYDKMSAKVSSTIKPHRKKLEKVVDLLIPMDTLEAEVFATVYAAWNDLVHDGKKFDDNKIIYEARDNWHPNKKKIPEVEFRNAISKIRYKRLVPDGTAKRVRGQEQLF